MRAPWEDLLPRAVFDPLTAIAGAGLAMNVVGTLTSAGAQKQQGVASNRAAEIQAEGTRYRAESQARIYEYKAGLQDWAAEVNENFAEGRANRVLTEAGASADIIKRSTSRALGRAQAAYGAAGVTSEGTPLMVMQDIATEGNLQEALATYGGVVAAGDIRAQARFDRLSAEAQGEIYRALATSERTAGNIGASSLAAGGAAAQSAADLGAGATLLTGLGRTAAGAYQLGTAKGPGTAPMSFSSGLASGFPEFAPVAAGSGVSF